MTKSIAQIKRLAFPYPVLDGKDLAFLKGHVQKKRSQSVENKHYLPGLFSWRVHLLRNLRINETSSHTIYNIVHLIKVFSNTITRRLSLIVQ